MVVELRLLREAAILTSYYNSRAPIVGIDVLRLAAAVMVMIYHFGFKAVSEPGGLFDKMTPYDPWLPGTWPMDWWGWVGVQIFFTISGLVIAFSAASPSATPARFLRRRVMRLWPVVIVSSCLAAVVEVLMFDMGITRAVTLWLHTIFFHPLPPWLMGQFWTLGIEVVFYGVVLVLLILGQTHRLPQLATALILIAALYWALRLMNDGRDPLGRITQLSLLQHGAFFGIGILLAARATSGLRLWDAVQIAIGVVVAGVQIKVVSGWEAGYAGLQGFWPVPFLIYINCVWAVWLSMRHNDRLVAWLGSGGVMFVRRLGVMTYPLYLIHNHVGKPVILVMIDFGAAPWVAIVAGIIAAFAAAWIIADKLEMIVYRALERSYDWVVRSFRTMY